MFGRVSGMKQRSIHRTRASISLRRRALQFDVLEERRLFAGMDGGLRVLVFEDPMSMRAPSETTLPAIEKVVFVDLNRDGIFQSQEPWSITDKEGVASFRGLAPGDYTVRVISQQSLVETTSPQPEKTGHWTSSLGVKQAFDWETDTIGWFVADHSLQKWDVSSEELLREIDLGCPVSSVAVLDSSTWLLINRKPAGSQLSTVDRSTGEVRSLAIDIGEPMSFAVVGSDIMVLASNDKGVGLYEVPRSGDSSFSVPDKTPKLAIGDLSRDGSAVYSLGAGELILSERFGSDTRFSTWENRSGGWQLVAERIFNGEARFANQLSDSKSFVVEIASGLAVLNNVSGLPIQELLEQASGPTLLDSSRNVLFTHSKGKLGTVSAWSTSDWTRLYDIPILDSAAGAYESAWGLTLGYLKDHLISVIDGKVYRHALNAAAGVAVSISDSAIREVAIGLRTRGVNRAPNLDELPDFVTDEDVPLTIPQKVISASGHDEDGDTLYYFVRSSGSKGQMQSANSEFAVFTPSLNANGIDAWSIQAFDGRSWSPAQTFRIDIRPVNDLPTGIFGSNEFRIPELSPGASLGRVEVLDPDTDALYRYAVSDGRFMVANGLLKLVPGVALDYEATSTLVVTVSAIEMNQNDFISKQVTVHVEDRNDPPQGILFNGSGAIPEKVAPYVVGNVGVIDQDRFEVFNVSVSDPRFEVVRNTVRVKPGAGVVYQEPGWVELTLVAVSQTTGDTLSRTERFRVIKDETPYHNDENPMDVDGDGAVTPLDPLIIINYINNHGPGAVSSGEGESGGQIDVDGDGQVTPLDILLIINGLNEHNNQSMGSPNSGGGNLPSAEGESSAKPAPIMTQDGNAAALAPLFGVSEDELLGRRPRRLAQ